MTKIIVSILVAVLVGLGIMSFQKDGISSDKSKLTNKSVLTGLLMRVSHANVVNASGKDQDKSVCFAASLPLTFSVNGEVMTVTDQINYTAFLSALHNVDDRDMSVIFDFPITISYEDGISLVLSGMADLHDALHNCNLNGYNEYDIECLKIHYPLRISFYDSANVENVLVFNGDQELFTFLNELDDDDAFVIDYPLTITNVARSVVAVNSNVQLKEFIKAADNECGERNSRNGVGYLNK